MRGSTPLDVAAASVMDNNELALALREPDLEKVRYTYEPIKHDGHLGIYFIVIEYLLSQKEFIIYVCSSNYLCLCR